MRAYFDYNATAPTRPEVIEAMVAAMNGEIGNPSSMHAWGRRARSLLDEARSRVAALLEVDPRALVFTSGATESNNLVLRGFAAAHPDGAIVTTTMEHASTLVTADALANHGYPVARIAVDRAGEPDWNAVRSASENTRTLVSTCWANGETGHVAPLERWRRCIGGAAVLHLDAAQAAGRIPLRLVPEIGFVSLSAHKMGGPRGIGALVAHRGATVRPTRLEPLATGGPQERGLRAGTENLAAIVGMGVACELARRELASECTRLGALRERLWQRLRAGVERLLRLTPQTGLANTLTVAVPGIGGDSIVAALDLAGFAVSTGAACAASAPQRSHVIDALAIEEEYRDGVVRMSMGRDTTAAAVEALANAFVDVVTRARRAA